MICMRDYWPNLAQGKQQITQFRATQGGNEWLGTTCRYVNRGTVRGEPVLQMDDYANVGWLDAWQMRWDDSRGWIEVGDKFPNRHKVYEVGKEICWGGNVEIDQVINEPIHVDVSASQGETTGIHNWGRQIVTIEAIEPAFVLPTGRVFHNVLRINVLQSWCKAQGCAWPDGQSTWVFRDWLAPGKGIIQTEYLQAPGQTFEPPRIDYAKWMETTWDMA